MTYDVTMAVQVRTAVRLGHTKTQVAREFGVSRGFVHYITARGFRDHLRRRPYRMTLRREKVKILVRHMTIRNGWQYPTFFSAREMCEALNEKYDILVTPRTVSSDLRFLGFVNRVRKNAPSRQRQDLAGQAVFKEYCARMRIRARNVLFSDEVYLTGVERTGRTQWVPRGQLPLPRERKDLRNYARRMFWAVVGVGYKGPLILLPNKDPTTGKAWRMDRFKYLAVCIDGTFTDYMTNGAGKGKWFLQDGARAHTARHCMEHFQKKGIKVLQNAAYSPHLNKIEQVWKVWKDLVGKYAPRTEEQLVVAAYRGWDELPQATIDSICKGFDHAVAAIA
jgi:transposase